MVGPQDLLLRWTAMGSLAVISAIVKVKVKVKIVYLVEVCLHTHIF
jgi:hypothetical protein